MSSIVTIIIQINGLQDHYGWITYSKNSKITYSGNKIENPPHRN